MDAASGWCRGCARTLAEIAGWGGAPDAVQRRILDQLPPRRVELQLAHRQGVVLDPPAQHPFNPLPLLRLAWACAAPEGQPGDTPGRWVAEQLFHHVWRGAGADANDAARLAALAGRLAPAQDPGSEAVKQRLRSETEAALALGVFGVPTVELDGRLFWGQDALPMLRAALDGDPWFRSGIWEEAGRPRPGIARKH